MQVLWDAYPNPIPLNPMPQMLWDTHSLRTVLLMAEVLEMEADSLLLHTQHDTAVRMVQRHLVSRVQVMRHMLMLDEKHHMQLNPAHIYCIQRIALD